MCDVGWEPISDIVGRLIDGLALASEEESDTSATAHTGTKGGRLTKAFCGKIVP